MILYGAVAVRRNLTNHLDDNSYGIRDAEAEKPDLPKTRVYIHLDILMEIYWTYLMDIFNGHI